MKFISVNLFHKFSILIIKRIYLWHKINGFYFISICCFINILVTINTNFLKLFSNEEFLFGKCHL